MCAKWERICLCCINFAFLELQNRSGYKESRCYGYSCKSFTLQRGMKTPIGRHEPNSAVLTAPLSRAAWVLGGVVDKLFRATNSESVLRYNCSAPPEAIVMRQIKNKVKGIFSARSKTPKPQRSPALTASAVGPSSSSLKAPSTSSLPQTTVTRPPGITAPLIGDACIGPHGDSANSHSTSQHFGPRISFTKVDTGNTDNTISQTPNIPTSSWNNLVVPPIAPLNPLAGDEIFREQLSKCQSKLTEAQKEAFMNGASPNGILDIIAELNYQHSESSITRKYATKVKGFLQVADNYLNTLGIIIQHSPEFSSLIVGGLRFFINIGKRYTDFFDKLEEAMEKWMHYLDYLSKFAELYSHYDEVKQGLCVAYGDLIEFFKCLYGIFVGEKGALNSKTSGTLVARQLIQPLETNIAAIMMNLNEHIVFIEKIASVLEAKRRFLKEKQEAEEKELKEKKEAEEKELKEKKEAAEKESRQRREILAWLSKLEPEKDLERIYAKRHDGTGVWFLNSPEVNEWFQEDKKSLLWCYGTAGVGKSVLASTLLKEIISKHQDNPSRGICFFFFNFQAADTQKPIQLFSVLLKQLCRFQKAIPQGLQALFTKCHSNDKPPTLRELQHQFEAVTSLFEEVFLVIDAFDECSKDDRKEILNGLTSLFQHCSAKLKLCITSRPEKDIKHAFTSSGFDTIKIEAKKVDQDISCFVQYQLQFRTHDHCTLNEEICKKIEYALVSKANGMFLWAKCQVDEIFEQPSIADIWTALQYLPSDIDATYRRIISKILKQTPAMRALAEWALTWVITAQRPLSPVELAQAVATNPEKSVSLDEVKTKYFPQTVVDSCHGLIAVEQNIVRPIHYTVQEFLVREWPWDSGWDWLNAHTRIAQSCLWYLDLFSTNPYMLFRRDRFNTLTYTGDLFNYIAISWPHHVKSCSVKIPSTLRELLQNLFSENLDMSSFRSILQAWYLENRNADTSPFISAPWYCAVVDLLPVYKQLFPNGLSQEDLCRSIYWILLVMLIFLMGMGVMYSMGQLGVISQKW
ncbi:hypothetical protein BDZ91DRAFT_783428 [Kalaharituber pfeilii]|nr:hypothetical protein BDZ91DRAFT_783428 [Kalaharituber pfeilii]